MVFQSLHRSPARLRARLAERFGFFAIAKIFFQFGDFLFQPLFSLAGGIQQVVARDEKLENIVLQT